MTRLAAVAEVGLGYALTAASQRLLAASPPGGRERWQRVNHRGEPVSLLEGPAAVAGLLASAMVAPGLEPRVRAASILGVGVAGTLGGYDDLAGSPSSKGLRGHLGALRRGEVTSGAVKLAGIGVAGLVCGAVLRPHPVEAVLAGGVVAGSANLVNLLDLRPGRALKATAIASAPLLSGGGGGPVAGLALGSACALLPEDLGERSMLGDAGANGLGAAVGVAAGASLPRSGLVAVLAGLVALTLLSERLSFTRVIEGTPGLRELDALGRRGPA
ncbi:MAG: hypothetical protein ABWZ26_05405 [Candidatus Nanopelagicales bacterium]